MKFNFDGDDIHYIAEDWFEILVANQDENKHLWNQDFVPSVGVLRVSIQLIGG